MAHTLPDLAEAPPKRRWTSLQPTVPAYDDPGFDAARRAWLAWWDFGKAMGFAGEVPGYDLRPVHIDGMTCDPPCDTGQCDSGPDLIIDDGERPA